MENFFYKYTVLVLIISALIFGYISYFVDFFVSYNLKQIIWMGITTSLVIIAIWHGTFIKKLYHNAYYDFLTGLGSRSYFYNQLSNELDKLHKNASNGSLAIIDIDNFKQINDTYNHFAGDEVLKQLATILRSNLGVNNRIARWGGEEFVVFLPQTDILAAANVLEELRKTIENFYFLYQKKPIKITISIGTTSTSNYVDSDILIKKADQALFIAKEKKNKVVCL